MSETMVVDPRFKGVEGIGQGGHFAGVLAERRGAPTRVWFRAPIPLGRPLHLEESPDGLVVTDGSVEIARAEDASTEKAPPLPVSLETAEAGRRWAVGRHHARVEGCFSCGMGLESFRVHAGDVGGGLFATPFVPPAWTAGEDGVVLDRFLWAPLDCAAGWRVMLDGPRRLAVTGWLHAEILKAVRPDEPLVVVADTEPEWMGRKRFARSAMYTADGRLVAQAESLWISVSGEPPARQ